jgi:putative transposase
MYMSISWTPKYRRKVIVGNIEQRLKALLKDKCKQLAIEVLSLQTMPDHVHIFVRARSKLPPSYLWCNSYFVSAHSHVSNETIEKYLEERSRDESI